MLEPPRALRADSETAEDGPRLPSRIVLPAFSIAVPLMHLVPHIQSVYAVGAEAGEHLLLMLAVAIGGCLIFGRLADLIGPFRACMAATAWQTALMLGFLALGIMQAFWSFATLYGFG